MIVALVTSPRLPAGLLTAQAWDLVRAHPVYAPAETDQVAALREAGVAVTVTADPPERGVWLGDPPPGAEVVHGSWDPPGARLLDLVDVTERLHAPVGGDPWRLEQTHQTLARYLLEEAYEAYDAIEAHDLEALREELGDVLLQVALHARMAHDAEKPWTVDDVAAGITAKLIRRNPHVFAGVDAADVEEITRNWERIKQEEKARTSPVEGIALSQPALALAAKIIHRARRAGVALPEVPPGEGAALFALVEEAVARGVDLEAELRRTALAVAEAMREPAD